MDSWYIQGLSSLGIFHSELQTRVEDKSVKKICASGWVVRNGKYTPNTFKVMFKNINIRTSEVEILNLSPKVDVL